ncbi:phosphatase PAP2 family protein [Umezawaea beigongshangensis]|uniref:phosphatase PAP2 family protein n=1 Tax=Umezawaea beigongshangensis TaxID=2780383 RepID=UPI0027DB7E50|nr:phosphatase PAP2 family protein [Umezawaea beigongshangensis]
MINTSTDLYRAITEFASSTPSWLQSFADWGTDFGLGLFGVLFLLGIWRERRGTARALALALLAPAATIGAYATSEIVKTLVQQERPCRAVAGVIAIAECPAVGDWSFPSNHATIAAASAGALALAWRRTLPLVLPLAAVMAFSRVFVGVHYPHDVAAGYLLGVTAAPLLALALVPAATPLVDRFRPEPPPTITAVDVPTQRIRVDPASAVTQRMRVGDPSAPTQQLPRVR